MVRYILSGSLCLLLLAGVAHAQPLKKLEKKYPSILWEITGKGMKRPSYLFGTMHVSNKMVFNLGDSFYHAIESTDYVGLELDPGYWQEYFSKNNSGNMGRSNPFEALERRFMQPMSSGSLTKNMFAITAYEKRIEQALNMEPTIINSLLYRKSQYGQEYEEDTYLDMYLYQICKKLNKQIVGLEVMETSEKMSKQAMLALQEGRGRSSYYDRNDDDRNTMSVEDAYKTGDLDMLDSIDRRETPVPKFRTIFIDDRNAIQANSIDSVIRLGRSIFAGVGAAHLPGSHGVIELLRRKGYTMRPVKLNNRNSLEKDRIDKIHFPVQFTTQYTSDSVIKADIPGPWYRFRTSGNLVQYSDLANGSYYILTRVPVDALFWGHNQTEVLRKIDSLLYENIPGKILSKTSITNSGYSGYDITNRTRRGDRQHYQIFATPFEVIIAKMSGIGEYVATGTEANSFFNSIRIRQLEKTTPVNFTPAWGAFSVKLPHTPYVINRIAGNTLMPYRYEATDAVKGIQYSIIKATRQRSNLLEEDTFELNLLSESYASSKMVEKTTGKKFIAVNGYPALEAFYKLKDGQYSMVRYILQGPHYYAVLAQQKGKPFTTAPDALSSFTIRPFQYRNPQLQTDSIFGYTVNSPVTLSTDKDEAEDIALIATSLSQRMKSIGSLFRSFFSQKLMHDSTGEMISMSGLRFPPYTYISDSSRLQNIFDVNSDSDFVVKKQVAQTNDGWNIRESWFTDTNSSRMLHVKTYYKNGTAAALQYYTDTLTGDSPFAQSVFSSFTPSDSISGANPLTPKGQLFFADYNSKDSTKHAVAIENLSAIRFNKTDLPKLKEALASLSWTQPNYLGLKKRFIAALGQIKDKESTAFLKELYTQSNDTALYQQQILYSLLNQRTQASFKAFEELITTNPPVEVSDNNYANNDLDAIEDNSNMLTRLLQRLGPISLNDDEDEYVAKDWDQLTDTLQLTKQILPGLINLMSLDDYKEKMEELVHVMADSNYASPDVLQPFYTKFLLEARQQYKKAVATESEAAMKKKTAMLKKNDEKKESGNTDDLTVDFDDDEDEDGHDDLYDKLVMLTPFYTKQQAVRDVFKQTFQLKDDEHLYRLMNLMIRKGMKDYPDTLLQHFAADPNYRYKLYDKLYDEEKLNLFPEQYHAPLELAKSRFYSAHLKTTDTMAFVGKRPFQLYSIKGDVYFFKYKAKKSENWKWGLVEMVPSKTYTGRWNMYYDDLDEATTKKLDSEQPLDEQMDKLLREKLASKHASAYQFYNDDSGRRSYYSYRPQSGDDED